MKKKIPITYCHECPYFSYDGIEANPICNELDILIVDPDYAIPSNCPLDNYESEHTLDVEEYRDKLREEQANKKIQEFKEHLDKAAEEILENSEGPPPIFLGNTKAYLKKFLEETEPIFCSPNLAVLYH